MTDDTGARSARRPPGSQRADGRTTDTRERARAVALELFHSRGFAATSLAGIAEQLGITKAALYYHFPAKADLARSVFMPLVDDGDRALQALAGQHRTSAEVLDTYARALRPHRRALAAMLRDPGAVADLDLESVSTRWLSQLAELLGAGTTPVEAVRVAIAVGGLTRALLLSATDDDDVLAEAVAAAGRALDG